MATTLEKRRPAPHLGRILNIVFAFILMAVAALYLFPEMMPAFSITPLLASMLFCCSLFSLWAGVAENEDVRTIINLSMIITLIFSLVFSAMLHLMKEGIITPEMFNVNASDVSGS
jgi:hypothetical protein